jgi:thiamine-phosphate pyrophosphorylase
LLLYYITDRSQFSGDETARRRQLLDTIAQAARAGVDYIQLREKDLSAHDLETLALESVATLRELRTRNQKLETVLLINSRTDVALASGAEGVHLRSQDISPTEVRRVWNQRSANSPARATVCVSCHTPDEVAAAADQGADFVTFGPVFEKRAAPQHPPVGIHGLREACKVAIPVIALGGVTLKNATDCLQAGAAGIAGIRLFQQNEVGKVVAELRAQTPR